MQDLKTNFTPCFRNLSEFYSTINKFETYSRTQFKLMGFNNEAFQVKKLSLITQFCSRSLFSEDEGKDICRKKNILSHKMYLFSEHTAAELLKSIVTEN